MKSDRVRYISSRENPACEKRFDYDNSCRQYTLEEVFKYFMVRQNNSFHLKNLVLNGRKHVGRV